jgi:hypothetical protein
MVAALSPPAAKPAIFETPEHSAESKSARWPMLLSDGTPTLP